MQNIGKVFKASALAAARQGLFFIPLVFILPLFWNYLGVELAQPIADIFTLLFSLPLQISVLREINKKIAEQKLKPAEEIAI